MFSCRWPLFCVALCTFSMSLTASTTTCLPVLSCLLFHMTNWFGTERQHWLVHWSQHVTFLDANISGSSQLLEPSSGVARVGHKLWAISVSRQQEKAMKVGQVSRTEIVAHAQTVQFRKDIDKNVASASCTIPQRQWRRARTMTEERRIRKLYNSANDTDKNCHPSAKQHWFLVKSTMALYDEPCAPRLKSC